MFLSTNFHVLLFWLILLLASAHILPFTMFLRSQFCRPVGGSSPTFILWVGHWHCFHHRYHLVYNITATTSPETILYGVFSQRTKSGEPESLYWLSCISPLQPIFPLLQRAMSIIGLLPSNVFFQHLLCCSTFLKFCIVIVIIFPVSFLGQAKPKS